MKRFEDKVKSREEDIKKRGANHQVVDYNGMVVNLKDAKIWKEYDGEYFPPESYEIKLYENVSGNYAY
tara:strand:- start:86 stop:289 length:204 start_codon:yes stop_codon:yes gene_type:complete